MRTISSSLATGFVGVAPTPSQYCICILCTLHSIVFALWALARFETRIVDTEELNGFDVSSLALIHGDEVKCAVVADAVEGHS